MRESEESAISDVIESIRAVIEADTDPMGRELGDGEDYSNFDWLKFAVEYGAVPGVSGLLSAGVELDEASVPILGWLTKKGDPLAVARVLIDNGADVNDRGGTPLHTAAHFGLLEVAQLLIERGAQQREDEEGKTPAHQAMQWGREDVGRWLAAQAGYACNCDGFFPEDGIRWFVCSCGDKATVPARVIDRTKGIYYQDPECGRTCYIPPAVWCTKCQRGLVLDWQSQIVFDDVEAAATHHTGPGKQYRDMARELIDKHGPLLRVEYLSHFPDFEIDFVFERATVHSGPRHGEYDIDFLSLGYVGEGPRYAREFLDEAGFPMTSEEIAAIQPGAVIRTENGCVVVDYPTTEVAETAPPSIQASPEASEEPQSPSDKKWWQFWK